MKKLKFRINRPMKKFRLIRAKHVLYRFFKHGIKRPKAGVVLDLTYPPGFLLGEGSTDLLATCSRHFNLHGLQEPWKLPLADQNPFLIGLTNKDVDKLPINELILERFEAAVLQLSPKSWDAVTLLRFELSKHGPHLPFIEGPDYFAEFCLMLLDRYGIPEMAEFIIEEARKGTHVPLNHYNQSWIGVTVRELLRICNSYPPIKARYGQINLELFRPKTTRLTFLYAISMALTSDGAPARRPRRRPEVKLKYHKKGTHVPWDTLVYLMAA